MTRAFVPKVEWTQCIYCHSRKRDKLHQVQSDDVAAVIRKRASCDETLKCRIGENDIIAYEAHYHRVCKDNAEKNLCHSQSDKKSTKPDAPLTNLTNILDKGLQRGNIYSMDAVHEKYISLQRHAGIVNPSIQVRTLKQKLEKHYGSQILFRKQRQLNQPQLLIPAKTTTEDVVALTLRDREENISPDDDDIDHESYFIQCLHTVATKLRADLSNTAGHQGYDNLNIEAAEQCVPTSLYLLIKWILDEKSTSTDTPDDDDEPHGKTKQGLHQKILNIGQNIVYNVSCGQKEKPKHIGTGLLVHHMTRSRQLVTYLHDCGDSISYPTVNRIDSSIAEFQVSRFQENENTFISESLVPGRFIQFAADNFDMLEETLDGKGTLHVTQIAAFQRGPPNPSGRQKSTIGRNTSLQQVPKEFHQLAVFRCSCTTCSSKLHNASHCKQPSLPTHSITGMQDE